MEVGRWVLAGTGVLVGGSGVTVGSSVAVGSGVDVTVGEGSCVAVWIGVTAVGTSVMAFAGAAGEGAQAARVERVRMAQVNTTGQPVSLKERCNEIGV